MTVGSTTLIFPEGASTENQLQDILARWIRNRAQQANVYMSLSQAFVEDPPLSEFCLNRALNEGNFANLAVFFQRTLGEYEMPQGDIDRIVQMQAQVAAVLCGSEQFLKKNPRPTVEEGLTMIMDNLESQDETVVTKFIQHILPRSPVAAKMFRSAVMDHCAKIAAFIVERAEGPNLRERATTFGLISNRGFKL